MMLKAPSLLLTLLLAKTALGSVQPGPETITADRNAEAIRADLAAGRIGDAIDRIEAIMAEPTVRLVKADTRLLPLLQWVGELLTDDVTRVRFADEFEKRHGQAAQQAMTAAVQANDVAAIFAVRHRYAWTKPAQRASTEAARVLVSLGDGANAKAIARAEGNSVAGREIAAYLQLPDEKSPQPMSFSPAWYSAVFPADNSKVVPVFVGDTAFIASPTAVAAVSKLGKLLWSDGGPASAWNPPQPAKPEKSPLPAPTDMTTSQPAVWCDPAGMPQVVVVRRTDWESSSIRAYRAGDGTPIWNTAELDTTGNRAFVGVPTIAGRFVYTLALDHDPASGAKLSMLALELTSGRTLWRCEIGDSFQPESRIIRRHEPRAFTPGMILVADHVLLTDVAIAMDDRNVYASFVGGTVAAVDRFGGGLQWLASYNTKFKAKGDKERERRDRVKLPNRRWRDLPVSNGQIVVIAPTDGDPAIALDAATGKQKWEQPAVRDLELVGIAGDRILFGGLRVAALKADTGEVAWQTPVDPKPSGPGFVEGDAIGIPTDKGGVMYYALDTGAAAARRTGETPTMDSMLRTTASRQALEPTGLLEAMKVALAAPADEKPVKPPPKKPEKPTPKTPEKPTPKTPEKKPALR